MPAKAASNCRPYPSASGTTSATPPHTTPCAASCSPHSTTASPTSTWPTTTAPNPDQAEKNCGRLLHEYFHHHRDELIISTKAGYEMWTGPYGDLGSRKYLLASLDQSLKRLGLDYVDIFYHHHMDPIHTARRDHGRARHGREQRQGAVRGPVQL
ncbi:MAG: aldo/keto reductase [Bifidobacterium adolescentis]